MKTGISASEERIRNRTVTVLIGDYWAVRVEPGDTDFRFEKPENFDNDKWVLTYKRPHIWDRYKTESWNFRVRFKAIPELIGIASTLTEDQAKDIVEYIEIDNKYKSYEPRPDPAISDRPGFWWPLCDTAIKSLSTLLKANNLQEDKTLIVKRSTQIMGRRIFIESDVIKEEKIITAKRWVHSMLRERGIQISREDVFQEVIGFAWHDLDKTWKSVLKADEIYASTALMPLISHSYSGAPVIFNGMMERAIKEGVTGKSVYIMRELKEVYWDMIDKKLIPKAFASNKLFMYDENNDMKQITMAELRKRKIIK